MIYVGNSYSPYYNYLSHEGKKRRSGRYPWGSGTRPFQREGGRKSRRQRKKEQAELIRHPENIRKSFQSKEQKDRVLKDSTATELLQYRNELTTQELDDALNRIKKIRELSNISKKEREVAWDAVDNAMNKVGKVKNWTRTSLETYGVVQEIMAAMSGDKARQDWSKKNQESLEQILNLLKNGKQNKGGSK